MSDTGYDHWDRVRSVVGALSNHVLHFAIRSRYGRTDPQQRFKIDLALCLSDHDALKKRVEELEYEVNTAEELRLERDEAERRISALEEGLRKGMELKLGAYPAHGSGFVAILTGGDFDGFQALARALLQQTEAQEKA